MWRAGRRVPCPAGAPVPARTRGAQCATCTALDRSSSIAADTRPDDPRAFAVYLAHHGSVVKVGITAEERGSTRLLEQGALSSTVVSTGTLMAARRSEHLLTTALGLPDRVAAQRKRTARARPGTPGERAAELLATAERVHALPAWPPIGQTPREPHVTDHTTAYGLPPSGLVPTAAVQPLEPGQTVTGRLACRIGSDLYLDTAAGLVLLDTRLLAGWALHPAPGDAAFTAGLEPLDDPREPQALF
ncbi:hypothetical protein SCATT_p07410 (plasmid) [Streptantibioticus cattleyicolor NRRL 8057 = DSM 46488]|uniref:DUF2797 domain-containing protein n=1 Tax=Streptantibioticus cattleyicolor (strain ATCC 35852 / DSM 46488 / JCM 4925 / NBRC 14057 / NRRL 8057) TaxID=1003195 RepID=G8XHR9_STREN|nr:hypothetical protein SCATT_p07410 [Streptantibioticus cattleyicolor NRRL 8057 = DSM 46488]